MAEEFVPERETAGEVGIVREKGGERVADEHGALSRGRLAVLPSPG